MSSVLPPKLRDAAQTEGFRVNDSPAGSSSNADWFP